MAKGVVIATAIAGHVKQEARQSTIGNKQLTSVIASGAKQGNRQSAKGALIAVVSNSKQEANQEVIPSARDNWSLPVFVTGLIFQILTLT